MKVSDYMEINEAKVAENTAKDLTLEKQIDDVIEVLGELKHAVANDYGISRYATLCTKSMIALERVRMNTLLTHGVKVEEE